MAATNTAWAWPWWTVIVIINAINLVVCAIIYKRSLPMDGSDTVYRKRMRIMGLLFTLVAVYRSVFVSKYTPQLAWFDSILNSSLLIRLFAIFAELSFAGLIAFALLQTNDDVPASDPPPARSFMGFMTTKTPYVLIICIFLAQFFATHGVITKSQFTFAIEETLWSLGFLSVLPLAIMQVRRVFAQNDDASKVRMRMLRISTVLIAAWCVGYCCYGVFYHVPIECWGDAIEQMRTGIPAIKSGSGIVRDAFVIVNETKNFDDWGMGFLFWHSAYFSVCAWLAIFLMQAPRKLPLKR